MNKVAYTFMVAFGFSAIFSIASIPFQQGAGAAEADTTAPAIKVEYVAPVVTLAPYTEPTPVAGTHPDNLGGEVTDEDELLLVCSPEDLLDNPQNLSTCYEDEWVWSCDPDGWCEFDEFDDPTGEGYDW